MSKENVFEIMGKLPWDKLRTQTEFCVHIPDAIRGLISSDDVVRRNSYWKLDNHVVVQGGLYEGALYIIPFLVELLKCTDVEYGRELIYDLLFEIGNGSAEIKDYVSYKKVVYESCHYYVPTSSDIKEPLQIACRNSVLLGFDVYVSDLANPLSIAREKSLELLGMFYEHEYLVVSVLKQIYENEESSQFKNKIEQTIEDLLED